MKKYTTFMKYHEVFTIFTIVSLPKISDTMTDLIIRLNIHVKMSIILELPVKLTLTLLSIKV